LTRTIQRPGSFVSVVIETVTALENGATAQIGDLLAPTLDGVRQQSYPRDCFETIVVLDQSTDAAAVAGLQRRYPEICVARAPAPNYFGHKNTGAAASHGDIIAFMDGDCVPEPQWLDRLTARFEGDVAAVAGRTRYAGRSVVARTFSVSDFGNIGENASGTASGFNLNNVAFRRDVALAHPLDARVRRNGGCYFLYHQLRAAGLRVLYEPGARNAHGADTLRGVFRKHFDRGFDGVAVYRLDDQRVLGGTRLVRRFGPFALILLTGRRILVDWMRIARERRQIGISAVGLPYYCLVMVATRVTELAGGIAASIASPHVPPPSPTATR
jgi:glycosyltransferase involved in cell wall biosynthesis